MFPSGPARMAVAIVSLGFFKNLEKALTSTEPLSEDIIMIPLSVCWYPYCKVVVGN